MSAIIIIGDAVLRVCNNYIGDAVLSRRVSSNANSRRVLFSECLGKHIGDAFYKDASGNLFWRSFRKYASPIRVSSLIVSYVVGTSGCNRTRDAGSRGMQGEGLALASDLCL